MKTVWTADNGHKHPLKTGQNTVGGFWFAFALSLWISFHFWVLNISGGTEFAELGRIFTWLGVSFYWRPSILSKGRKWLLKKPFSWLFELQLQFSHYYQVMESAFWRSNACIRSDFNQSLSTIGATDINWQSNIIIGLLGRIFYSRSKPGKLLQVLGVFPVTEGTISYVGWVSSFLTGISLLWGDFTLSTGWGRRRN
jgi:hypothetical protein